jgi:peptidyl-prolyl cis-trans isomerase C
MFAKSLIAVGALLALGGAAMAEEPAPDDPVVATVNGGEIHLSDLVAAMQSLPEQMRQVPLEAIYERLLDRMIDSELLASEAERLDLDADPDVQPMLDRARANVMRDALLRQKVDEGTTDDQLATRYEALKQTEGFARAEVHARHILVKTEDEAKAVIAELEGGAEFDAVAKSKSIEPGAAQGGGDLGYFTQDQMVPEFGQAAFAMDKGERSTAPVQTQFGWHVIEVIDKRTVEPSLEESKPQLRQEAAREIVTALVDGLRADAKIERFGMDGGPLEAAPAPEAPAEAAPAAPAAPAQPQQ